MGERSHHAYAKFDHAPLLNLGCGPDYREGWCNVDQLARVDPDRQFDITETPWPFADDAFERILASHCLEHVADVEPVLRECARVLLPGGLLEVRLPVGADARTDPTHESVWHWDTPRHFCGHNAWDADVGLRVLNRNVELWSHLDGVAYRVHEWLLERARRRWGPGRWQFGLPATSGEFTVRFEVDT